MRYSHLERLDFLPQCYTDIAMVVALDLNIAQLKLCMVALSLGLVQLCRHFPQSLIQLLRLRVCADKNM